MKEKKCLFKLNMLAYFNNFLYIIISDRIEIKGILSLWVLLPFIFLLLTSFMLENKYHKERIYLKKYAISDWVIRFLGECSAFTELGLATDRKLFLCSIFMIMNIIIEIIMLRLNPIDEKIQIEDKYFSKINMEFAEQSVTIGVISFIFTSVFFGMNMVLCKINLVISIAIVILYSFVFIIIEINKINNCYTDKLKARKIYLRNIGVFSFAIIIWVIQKLYIKMDFYDNLTNLLMIIAIMPSISTTRTIGIVYRKNQKR